MKRFQVSNYFSIDTNICLKKSILIIFINLLLINNTFACADFGGLIVNSALDEPFDAKIPISGITQEMINQTIVKFPPKREYTKVGLGYEYALTQATLKFESDSNDNHYILLTTDQPIKSPIFSLLIQIINNQCNMIKEYTVLLDPRLFNINRNRPKNDNKDSSNKLTSDTTIKTKKVINPKNSKNQTNKLPSEISVKTNHDKNPKISENHSVKEIPKKNKNLKDKTPKDIGQSNSENSQIVPFKKPKLITEILAAELDILKLKLFAPQIMIFGEPSQVKIVLTNNDKKSHIKAKLIGSDVIKSQQLTPSTNDQIILPNKQGIWTWNINPTSVGLHEYYINFEIIDTKTGVAFFSKTLTKKVMINNSIINQGVHFLKTDWKWFITTLLIPFAVWLWYPNKKKNK